MTDLAQAFANSFIVIDEFQNLYSQNGLNSYGETFKEVFKHVISSCKVLCLTGTPINTKTEELRMILDIFNIDTTDMPMDKVIKLLGTHTITYNKFSGDLPDKKYIQEGPSIGEFKVIRCPMSHD